MVIGLAVVVINALIVRWDETTTLPVSERRPADRREPASPRKPSCSRARVEVRGWERVTDLRAATHSPFQGARAR